MHLNLYMRGCFLLLLTVVMPQHNGGSYTSQLLFHTPSTPHIRSWSADEKIKGITLVAPPDPFKHDPFDEIGELGANWVSIVPYSFASKGNPALHYDSPMQWWGERPKGVVESIRKAHESGMRVMLKPHVYIPGGWVGHLDFDAEEDWLKWELGYRKYIVHMATIAQGEQVELFCFSTEFKHTIKKRMTFWNQLIKDVRSIYKGPLTFSSNWDYMEEIPFWDQMDYIGVSAYFPLSQKTVPCVDHLRKEWKPVRLRLKALSKAYGKKVLFTEYGYLSVEYTAKGHWILEPNIDAYTANQLAQANALEALYRTFWDRDWWAGGFLWKWYPNDLSYTGFPAEKDYTPQGKKAIKIIQNWYSHGGHTR